MFRSQLTTFWALVVADQEKRKKEKKLRFEFPDHECHVTTFFQYFHVFLDDRTGGKPRGPLSARVLPASLFSAPAPPLGRHMHTWYARAHTLAKYKSSVSPAIAFEPEAEMGGARTPPS